MICKHENQEVKRVVNGWEIYCRECKCLLGRHGLQGGTSADKPRTDCPSPNMVLSVKAGAK